MFVGSLFAFVPSIVCCLCLLGVPSRNLRRIVPLILWLGFATTIGVVTPVFRNQVQQLIFSADFGIDRISAAFLLLTNFVAASALTHASSFFQNEEQLGRIADVNYEKWFYFYSALFVGAMDSVFLAYNIGMMWIAIEATTLFSAALVYYGRDKHALEATWKYLFVCSVGIAFALLGTILFFASSQYYAPEGSLDIRVLFRGATQLQPKFVQLGYIFCLLGYGTKAGLFPLHTWLPDAHSEAPAPASAMLSGSLLNCALFAICRLTELVRLTHNESLAVNVPIIWGSITMLAASLFLVNQAGIKRLWAYSSIENVGIMLCAIGLGSPSLFLFQSINHSMAKVALFLLSGNIIQLSGTKELSKIRGLLESSPWCGVTFIFAAAALTGMPPFGAFVSEWLILVKAADDRQLFCVFSLFISLALSFIAISVHVAKIVLGTPKTANVTVLKSASIGVPVLLCAISLALGITNLTQQIMMQL